MRVWGWAYASLGQKGSSRRARTVCSKGSKAEMVWLSTNLFCTFLTFRLRGEPINETHAISNSVFSG